MIKLSILRSLLLLLFFCFHSLAVVGVNNPLNPAPNALGKQYPFDLFEVDTQIVLSHHTDQNDSKGCDCTGEGQPLRAGFSIPTSISSKNSGEWIQWPGGEIAWILRLESPNAPAISLKLEDLDLPDNAYIHIYSDKPNSHVAVFTANDIAEGFLSPPLYQGDALYVEYRELGDSSHEFDSNGALHVQPKGSFTITEVVYIYHGLETFSESKGLGDSDACHVNINCSEGQDWLKQKRGIIRILYRDGTSWYWCTGTLINNTLQDRTPYVLTAEHCGGSTTSAERREWEFYFGYEYPVCDNSGSPPVRLITGCSQLAKGPMNGGSDFQLLLLSSSPTLSWNPYFNGWDRSTMGASRGASIHHPSGDAMKISTYNETLASTSPTVSGSTMAPNSAWRVYWAKTDNGHGVTEGGSSGAPLFNVSGLIVGTLSGGAATCSNPNSPDYFAKFNYHWASNGESNNTKLAPWLDPTGTNPMILDGYNPTGGIFAGFTMDKVFSHIGSPVTFSDASGGGDISEWSWSFGSGAVPATATGNGPHTVTYTTQGRKTISLTINGQHTITREEILHVGKSPFMEPSSFSARVIDLNNVQLHWSPPMLIQDDSFESYPNFATSFSPWIQFDGDGMPTWGIDETNFPNEGYVGSFIILNPYETTPRLNDEWKPRTGRKYAACFAADPGPNKDWLITPKIKVQPGYLFSFYAKSISNKYGPERLRVGVSTTGTNPANFRILSQDPYVEVPTEWTHYVYDLSDYEGQVVHLTINCVSNDAFALLIDDVLISDVLGNNIFQETFEDTAKGSIYSRTKVDPENSMPYHADSKDIMTLQGYSLFKNNQPLVTINSTEQLSYFDEDLDVGTYFYQIKANYSAPEGLSERSDSVMVSINPGRVLFRVLDPSGNPIHGAMICVEGEAGCLFTNPLGFNSINLPSGDYSYTVQSVFFDSYSSAVNVDSTVVPTNIILTPSSGPFRDITFSITDGTNPISSTLWLRSHPLPFTVSDGSLTLSLPHGEYGYLIDANGYTYQEGTLTVNDTLPETIHIALTPKEFIVSFLVTGYDNRSIENSTIIIDGIPHHIYTNSFGIASISLPNGNYKYTAYYTDQSQTSSFNVNGGNKTIGLKFEMMSIVQEISDTRTISIYPNPFSSHFTISNASEVTRLELTCPFGRTLKSINHDGRNFLTINADWLPAGMYIVTLVSRNGEQVSKRIVKN